MCLICSVKMQEINKNYSLNSFLACDWNFSCTELSNMFYDGVRLKWLDDLENVKRIVCQIWGLEGKWSSPGGQIKRKDFLVRMLTWCSHGTKVNKIL